MKPTTRAIIVACNLAIGVQAQAAINPDNALNPFLGTGAGELFLSVVDRGGAVQRSYVLDLGITAADYLENDASYVNNISIAADANLQNILNNVSGSIAWNLAAAYNIYVPVTYDQIGYLSTSSVALTNSNTPNGFIAINANLQQIGTYLQVVNGTDTNFTSNVSQIFAATDNAFYDGPIWGNLWNATFPTEGALDESLGLYYVHIEDIFNDMTDVDELLGEWTLSSNGTLTYASAPVPVPAAFWLLGSALTGLIGATSLRRREDA